MLVLGLKESLWKRPRNTVNALEERARSNSIFKMDSHSRVQS